MHCRSMQCRPVIPKAIWQVHGRQQMVVVGMMVLDSVQQLGCVVVVCW